MSKQAGRLELNLYVLLRGGRGGSDYYMSVSARQGRGLRNENIEAEKQIKSAFLRLTSLPLPFLSCPLTAPSLSCSWDFWNRPDKFDAM